MKNFWNQIDVIVDACEIVIDRPKGSKHPRFPGLIYPLDYGYLRGTKSSDSAEIDIWRGTKNESTVDSIICTVDQIKLDSEMKILIGCTVQEEEIVLEFYNSLDNISGILIERDKTENYREKA